MRKFIQLLVAICGLSSSVHAATITWIGSSGSNWNVATNWSPASVPTVADDVVFNTSVTVEMDIIAGVAPYTINSLLITGNATVILTKTQGGGGIRILRVASTSSVVPGLKIDNGASLTISAVNNTGTLDYSLDLTGAAGVTGDIAGSLLFNGPGTGTGNSFLNLFADATHYANLVVRSSGIIRYYTNSGNTNSSPTGTYLTMQSGSTYEINKNGGSLPQGNWDDNSTILITGATANGGIIFTQTRYGNMEWSTPAMSAITQLISAFSSVTSVSLNNLTITNTNGRELRLKTGATSVAPPYDCIVRGNFTIAANAIFVITGINVVNAGAGARLYVMGDIDNKGTFRTDGAPGTINDLELNGSANQNITNSGTLSGTQLSFIMNNTDGVTLRTPLTLPGMISSALQLINGKIKTSSAFPLRMLDNAGYTGGSSLSFVEGPMVKAGDDPSFTFPVGKGSIYAPVSFNSTGLAVTDEFQAEYMRLNPQNIYGTNYESPFDHISYVEYWNLDKISGSLSVPVNVTLSVTPYSFAEVMNTTYISRYNAGDGQWKNNGTLSRVNGTPVPPNVTGTIQSVPLAELGAFTLATTDPFATNPLPLKIISFNATRTAIGEAEIKWKIAGDKNEKVYFEVQRSDNGKDFRRVTSFYSAIDVQDYFAKDNISFPKAWYRLKLIDKNGEFVYSRTVTVINVPNDFIVNVFPNPSQGNSTMRINSPNKVKVSILIHDVSGKIILTQDLQLVQGDNRIKLNTENLSPGIFTISVLYKGTVNTIRFVKL